MTPLSELSNRQLLTEFESSVSDRSGFGMMHAQLGTDDLDVKGYRAARDRAAHDAERLREEILGRMEGYR